MRLFPVALSCVFSLILIPQTNAENILEIYEDAVNNDLVMRAARAQLRAGQEDVKIARGSLLPQIFAKASINEANISNSYDDPTVDTLLGSDAEARQTSTSAGLDQVLFNMNRWYTFRAGQQLSEKAEIDFQKAQQELIVRTTKAYLDVLRAHNNLESSVAEEKAVKQQLDQTQQRFDVGLVAITDVHESRAIYDLSKVGRLANEGVLETSYEGLSVLTGRIYGHVLPLSDNLPVTMPTPSARSAWQELAIQGNWDIKAARVSTKAAQYNSKAASANHLPVVSANLAYSNNSIDSLDDLSPDTLSKTSSQNYIGLSISLPIYSGGAVSANRRKAFAQYDQARETLAASERSITQQIRASHISVLTSIQEVAARKQSITSAQSAVDAIQAGYNYGTRNIVDVLNAQRNLFASQRDYANARYDYILRLLDLKKVAGILTPADIHGLNQWISGEMKAKSNPAVYPIKREA